jgi:hypothetical protein
MNDIWDDWEQKWIKAGSPRTLVEWIQKQYGRRLTSHELRDFSMWAVLKFGINKN